MQSIDGAPVLSSAVGIALLEGVYVIELFSGLCGGLEMLLRNRFAVYRYFYCDKSRSAIIVAQQRMHTLSMRYPELFPAEAWVDALSYLNMRRI